MLRPTLRLAVQSARLLIALAGIGSRAYAQTCQTTVSSTSCNVTVTASLAMPYVAVLSASMATTSITVPSVSGSLRTVGPQITARANAAYAVSIRAGSATWTFTGLGADPLKPATDLGFETSATSTFADPGTFTTISPAGSSLLTGAAATQSSIFLRWQTAWSWAASKPGTYTLPITFTLTVP
jgi:hypothetical protein